MQVTAVPGVLVKHSPCLNPAKTTLQVQTLFLSPLTLGVLVDTKLNMSQQQALATKQADLGRTLPAGQGR